MVRLYLLPHVFWQRCSASIRGVDAIFCLALTGAAIKLMAGIHQVDDLKMFDEALYLMQGVNLAGQALPVAAWGPFYVWWYHALHQVVADPIQLHFVNQQVLVVLTAIALYPYLRSLTIAPVIALLASSVYLFSTISAVEPRPTHLALLIFLLGGMVANGLASRVAYCALLSVTFLLMAFCRPEYMVAFVVMGLIGIFCAGLDYWQTKHILWNAGRDLLIAGVVSAVLIWAFGNPLSGGRSWFAFSQHFALNWVQWENSELNPWDHHETITQAAFGAADTLPAAIAHAPNVMLHHLLSNGKRYLKRSIVMLRAAFEYYRFAGMVTPWVVVEMGGVGLMIWYLGRQWRRITQTADPQRLRRLGYVFIALCPTLLPAVLLIYPRYHYLVVQVVVGLALLALLVTYGLPKRRPGMLRWSRAVVLAGLLVVLTPNWAAGWCVAPHACWQPRQQDAIALPYQRTVRFLQLLNLQSPVHILDADGGVGVYAWEGTMWTLSGTQGQGKRPTWYLPWDKSADESAQAFIQRKQINVILITPTLTGHPRFEGDRTFQSILENPASVGLRELDVPQTDFKVLAP